MTRAPPLAKLSRPRLHQAVARGRLFAVLDNARTLPLVWLAAPPGAGKTTLVATYLQSSELPAIWYQVDPGDADPAAFFYYLGLGAAHGTSRRKPRALPLLTVEYQIGIGASLTARPLPHHRAYGSVHGDSAG
jgi:hypothetical protein